MESLENYVRSLSYSERQVLQEWLEDNCYACPLPDTEAAQLFEEEYVAAGTPEFVARVIDMRKAIKNLKRQVKKLESTLNELAGKI